METIGNFVLVSLNLSNFSKFSQMVKFRQQWNKIFANLLYSIHEFVKSLNNFSKIKDVLNLFLWNLLKVAGTKINCPKVYEIIQFLKSDMFSNFKKVRVITVLIVLTSLGRWHSIIFPISSNFTIEFFS